MRSPTGRNRALKLALIAIMTALLEGGKFALSFIPNVEIVTLLCGIYGYVFGIYGLVATYLFVALETLIWGVNAWVITYLIHWGFVTLIFILLGNLRVKNTAIITTIAVLLTAAFGVLSSLVDTGLFTGVWNNFWQRFAIIYTRGAVFYIVQIICNLLLFATVFKPLVNRIDAILPTKFKSINLRRNKLN